MNTVYPTRLAVQVYLLLALAGAMVGMANHATVHAELPTGFAPGLSTNVSSVTTVANTQTIVTSAPRSIGSFNTFNISAGSTVNVNQPTASSAFMAQVRNVGAPSSILGNLNSNGAVGIINPAGVFVGPSGVIATNGFVATTQQLNTTDFLSGGSWKFSDAGTSSTAEVINQGTIQVGDGTFVTLLAPKVTNSGTIEANGGDVNLVSAKSIEMQVGANNQPLAFIASTDYSNAFKTGSVFSGIVNNSGQIRANAVALSPDGTVRLLAAGGQATVGGTVEANQAVIAESSGDMQVSGDVTSQGSVRYTSRDGQLWLTQASETNAGGDITLGSGRVMLLDGLVNTFGGNISGLSRDNMRVAGRVQASAGSVDLQAYNFLTVQNAGSLVGQVLAQNDINLTANSENLNLGNLIIEGVVASDEGNLNLTGIDIYLPGRVAALDGDVTITTGYGNPDFGYVYQTGELTGNRLVLNLAGERPGNTILGPDTVNRSTGFGGGRFDNADFGELTGTVLGNLRYEDTDGVNIEGLTFAPGSKAEIYTFTPGNSATNGFGENQLLVTGAISGADTVELFNGPANVITNTGYGFVDFTPGSDPLALDIVDTVSVNAGVSIQADVSANRLIAINNQAPGTLTEVTGTGSLATTSGGAEQELIVIATDVINLEGAVTTDATTGIVALGPNSAGLTIGLAGGLGTFNLSQGEINQITTKDLFIGLGPTAAFTLEQPDPSSKEALIGRSNGLGGSATGNLTVQNVFLDPLNFTSTSGTISVGTLDLSGKPGQNLTLNTTGSVVDATPLADAGAANINLGAGSTLFITGGATGIGDRYTTTVPGVGAIGNTTLTGDLDVTVNGLIPDTDFVQVSSQGNLLAASRIDDDGLGLFVNVLPPAPAGPDTTPPVSALTFLAPLNEVANLQTLPKESRKIKATVITNNVNPGTDNTTALEGSNFDTPTPFNNIPLDVNGLGLIPSF